MTETNNNRYTTYYSFTRKEFDELLKTPFNERKRQGLPVFEWEHCAKSFQHISNDLAIKYFMEINDMSKAEYRIILRCEYNSDVYYFGVEPKDRRISLNEFLLLYQYGTWSIYTWCDESIENLRKS